MPQVHRGFVISVIAEQLGASEWQAAVAISFAGTSGARAFGVPPLPGHSRDTAVAAANQAGRDLVDQALTWARRATPLGALQRLFLDMARAGEAIEHVAMHPDMFRRVLAEGNWAVDGDRALVPFWLDSITIVSSPSCTGTTAEVQLSGPERRLTIIDLDAAAPPGGWTPRM